LESTIHATSTREIRRISAHINDPEFTAALLAAFAEMQVAQL
jgi:uncharacterized protein (UPF0261 family)